MKLNWLPMSFRLSISTKILIIFLVIIMLLMAINININIVGANSIKKQITEIVKSKVSFYSKGLDREIERIQLQQLMFMQYRDLLNVTYLWSSMNNFERTQAINRIREQLKTIDNSSSYILNAGVFIKTVNRTVSSQKGQYSIPNAEYNTVMTLMDDKNYTGVYIKNGRLFILKGLDNKINLHESDCISYIELSTDRIANDLSGILGDDNKVGGVLFDQDNFDFLSVVGEKAVEDMGKQYINSSEINFLTNKVETIDLDSTRFWVISDSVPVLNAGLLIFIPENSLIGPIKSYNSRSILLLIVVLGILFVFILSVTRIVHTPLKQLVEAFKSLQADNMEINIHKYSKDEFGYLFESFNNIVQKIKNSIQQIYEQKIALQQSELKQLQSQINPHFLYNAFFNINMMCRNEEYDNVTEFTEKLGRYFQYITRNGMEEVEFKMEYQHAMDYAGIQNMRFYNRINADFEELPLECENLKVPKIIIQPILENIYEHGFRDKLSGGLINIRTKFDTDMLQITIEDSGKGMTDEELEKLQTKLCCDDLVETTGILNVHRRIALKFGKGSGLRVNRSHMGGLKIDVVMFLNR